MAAAEYSHSDETMDYTPGSATDAGTVVIESGGAAGTLVGITKTPIAAGALGTVHLRGTFWVDKLSTDVCEVGERLYWDAGNSRATTTASTHKTLGYAVAAASGTDTRVLCRLIGTGQ